MAQYSTGFEAGTVDSWADAGQSTVGVEVGSPITGSFSLKIERTAAQGTGTVTAQRDISSLGVTNGLAYDGSCQCVRTGSNLTTAVMSIGIYDISAALLQTITGPTVNITSQNTLTVSGKINVSGAFIVRVKVESDANALDNGTDRLRIDTVLVNSSTAQAVSGAIDNTHVTGALTTSFIAGPFDIPLLRPTPRQSSNLLRM